MRAAWPALALLALWLACLLLQWLPLPAGWVRVLSPQAAALHAAADAPGASRLVTLSVDPHATYVFWLKSCAYAAAFALTLLLVRGRRRLAWLCGAIVASGLVQAFYGSLLHLAKVDMEILGMPIQHAAQASGGFVNRNHLAGLLEMSLAVGIGLMIGQLEDRPRRSWREFVHDTARLLLSGKAMLRLVLVIMVVALVMTRSRMGNTAFFASLLAAGAIGLALSRHAPRGTVLLIGSLIAIDVALIGAWFGVEHTMQRIAETTVKDVEERVEPGLDALRILADYPLFGTGAGTFYAAYPAYRRPEINAQFDHAHNDFLQFLAETGLVGAGLMTLFVLTALACALLAQARRRDPLARGVAFGVTMGVIAIGIHSTVDFNLQIPANAFLFTILLALGWLSLSLNRTPVIDFNDGEKIARGRS
ncbi:MAG: O-antigen ligase family protein [Burkholderiales bacterium]|nr:O-antigen ligase family protein [Burkholderiales bacterium]